MRISAKTGAWLAGTLLLVALAGCGERQTSTDAADRPVATPVIKPVAIPNELLTRVGASRTALCESTQTLAARVQSLTEEPSADHLEAARSAWRQAHGHWRHWVMLQRLAEATPRVRMERIDAQPILPGYLDRVPGYPTSGLVYSEVPLAPQALAEAHQSTDVYYGVLGFHPLEFMLWGVPDANGEPTRKAETFVDRPETGSERIEVPARRRTLILNMATLLNRDLRVACALPQQPARTTALAAQLADSDRRRGLVGWLENLGSALNQWQESPGGEDRNGMPLWHNAFARTDFAEWRAQLDWLVQYRWPDALEKAVAAPLQEALAALEKQGPKAGRLDTASAATAELILKLTPSETDKAAKEH